jgi:hypothetical protein
MEAEYVTGTLKPDDDDDADDDDVPGGKKRRQMSQRPLEPEGGKHRNQANARERDRTHR